MSRIGRTPIPIPKGVDVEILQDRVKVKGPKGSLEQKYDAKYVSVEKDDNNIYIKEKGEFKNSKAMHGLYRSVGYKAALSGNKLTLSVGFSHDIVYNIPDGVTVEVGSKGVEIKVSGIDKQLVGLVASQIRSFRPPEPYKGKGIRYKDEYIRRKMGKAANK